MPRKTIHLVQRDVFPLRCLVCQEVAAVGTDGEQFEQLKTAVCYNRRDWDTVYINHPEYRRCIDSPDHRDKPKLARYPTPDQEGFYWAEWRIVEDGTFEEAARDDEDRSVAGMWVVLVRDRGPIDEPSFVVDVPGYDKVQPVDNFVWRSERLGEPE